MFHTKKLSILILLAGSYVLFMSSFHIEENNDLVNKPVYSDNTKDNSSYHLTSEGTIIEWGSNVKLKYSDFQADKKRSPGFAVATTASAFGYRINDTGGEISGSVFVVFYCNKSWWNRDYLLEEVLEHEQLHFDICELYGRKLYKEIIALRKSNRLSIKNINKVYSKLDKQYSNYQDKYDEDTDHSTNVDQQRLWNKKVKKQLAAMSRYSNYYKF